MFRKQVDPLTPDELYSLQLAEDQRLRDYLVFIALSLTAAFYKHRIVTKEKRLKKMYARI